MESNLPAPNSEISPSSASFSHPTPPDPSPIPSSPPIAPAPTRSHLPIIIFMTTLFIIFSGLLYWYYSKRSTSLLPSNPQNIDVCPQDTKICPDGTSLSRSGPTCDFGPCQEPAFSATDSAQPASPSASLVKPTFILNYPPDFKLSQQDTFTTIYKHGPTQSPGTEVYDGIILTIRTIDKGVYTLESYVDSQINQLQDPSQLISPKQATTVNDYPAFTYSTSGLGEYVHYVVQSEPSSPFFRHIEILVADPGNLGFSDQVEHILDSLELTQ